MTSHKHIVDILIPIMTSHNCNIDIWNYNCEIIFMDSQKKVLNVKGACHMPCAFGQSLYRILTREIEQDCTRWR